MRRTIGSHCLPRLVVVVIVMVFGVGPTWASPTERVIMAAHHDWLAQADGAEVLDEAEPVPIRPRWPDRSRIRFGVNPERAPAGAVAAVREAASTWGTAGIGVRFDFGGETNERGAESDQVNVVSWVDTPNENDRFVARTTTYWFADAPEEIIGFDLRFNLDHQFVIGEDDQAWDVETISLHEFGHALGLGHADPERVLQIMRPQVAAGDVDRTPSLRDVDALGELYGQQIERAVRGLFAAGGGGVATQHPLAGAAGSGEPPEEEGLFD